MKNETYSAACVHDDSAGVGEQLASRLSLQFPDAYLRRESMAELSLAIKGEQAGQFCVLPFCHTVEGEALGGQVNYGDARIGPRPGRRICKTPEDVLSLPSMDLSSGRISEVLAACACLSERGEAVMLNVSGPLTALNVLMETSDVFSLLMKQDSGTDEVFAKLSEELLGYAEAAAAAGVALISYADPISGADILGPNMAEQIARRFTTPFLCELESRLKRRGPEAGQRRHTAAILCPKTARALKMTGLAHWMPLSFSSSDSLAAVLDQAAEQAAVLSGSCVKQLQRGFLSGGLAGLVWEQAPSMAAPG